jgi:hypothetical protein
MTLVVVVLHITILMARATLAGTTTVITVAKTEAIVHQNVPVFPKAILRETPKA